MPRPRPNRRIGTRGFSLLELLIALSLVVVAVAALAQLCAVAEHANAHARSTTVSVLLAQQKMEEIVAAVAGQDTAGPTSLGTAPGDALERDTAGWHDYVDYSGASYLRRWAIDPLAAAPDSAYLLRVLVTPARGSADAERDVTTRPGAARLMTVRTRRS